jgi:hypothetical protein
MGAKSLLRLLRLLRRLLRRLSFCSLLLLALPLRFALLPFVTPQKSGAFPDLLPLLPLPSFPLMLSPSASPSASPAVVASLASLLAFCQRQARIKSTDYFDPRFARPDEKQAWLSDCAKRNRARKLCFRVFPGRLKSAASEALIPGDYGRLSILPDGSADYTSGQYAPLEIYGALLSYLEATN